MDIIIDDQLPNKHAAKPQVSFYKSDRNGPLLMAIKIKKMDRFITESHLTLPPDFA